MLIGVIAEELLLAEAARSTEVFIDVDLFPSAALAVPGFLLLEGQFDEGDVFYQTVVSDGSKIILPQLVIDGDTFRNFTSSLVRALASSLVLDVDTFYIPTVLSTVLGPSLFIDDDLYGGVRKVTQGKASINQQFPIDLVFDSDIFRSPIIELANRAIIRRQTATPASTVVAGGALTSILPGRLGQSVIIADTTSFGALPLGYLSPNLFNAVDIIFAPLAFSGLVPSVFIDGDVFFAPVRLAYVAPSVVSASDIFFTPSAAKQLPPSAVNDVDVFIGPTVGTPGRLGLVIDNDAILAPAVRIAPLAPSLIANDDVVLAPVIGAPALKPGDGVVDFADTLFAPAVLATQQLTPHFWVDVDDILAVPSVTIGARPPLGPGIVTDTDAFFAPSVAGIVQTALLAASRAGLGSTVVVGSGKIQIIANVGAVK